MTKWRRWLPAADEGPGTVAGSFRLLGPGDMALRFKLQHAVVADDDGEQVSVDEIVVLTKEHERMEHLGLTLGEAKALLLAAQHQILTRQVAAFLAARVPRPSRGRARGIKDRKTIVFRT